MPAKDVIEYKTATPNKTITDKANDVGMPIRPARAAAMVEPEVPAVMLMEPTAAKIKMKSTTFPNKPFTFFSPTAYLHKALNLNSSSFLMW